MYPYTAVLLSAQNREGGGGEGVEKLCPFSKHHNVLNHLVTNYVLINSFILIFCALKVKDVIFGRVIKSSFAYLHFIINESVLFISSYLAVY